MGRKLLALVASAATLCVQPASAQVEIPADAVRLSPSMPWNVDFAEQSCAARRIFGDGTHEAFLELRQFSPGNSYQMLVSSGDVPRRSDPRFAWLPDTSIGDPPGTIMGSTSEGFGEGYVVTTGLLTFDQQAAVTAAAEAEAPYPIAEEVVDNRHAEIQGLLVERGFRNPMYLETGSLGRVMQAMETCMNSLLESWGIDPAVNRTITVPVKPLDMARLAREVAQVYPQRQLQRGAQGLVNIRMLVDAQGQASNCVAQAQMNDPVFNRLACERVLRFARFEPALDAAGQPVDSFWTTAVVYMMN
ncbi:energy transducer TonB [Aurantiacibacter luteus]|uniref:TonB C-terminal domain-containing protein n=1 Tax=Aurantiacibacter luteus TaxID=1581420 RepID=A0A0G9MX71_9SPHN|nr:energy transducer TonB [Aurantiacibacter luteus]KLE35295.1 hypothetical protein AAW00_02225 [Aurantiacibacter luteus]